MATYTTTFADNCYFGGPVEFLGGGTIPVDAGGVDAGTLTFNNVTGSILLSGGPITLKAAAIITANNTNTHTINSVIAGAATSLTKAGTGTVVLSGVNTYAGPTQIDGGILVFGNTSAKASGLVTAAATGTIGLGVGVRAVTPPPMWLPYSTPASSLASARTPLPAWPSTPPTAI